MTQRLPTYVGIAFFVTMLNLFAWSDPKRIAMMVLVNLSLAAGISIVLTWQEMQKNEGEEVLGIMYFSVIDKRDSVFAEGLYKTNADIGTVEFWCESKGWKFRGPIKDLIYDEDEYVYVSAAQMLKDIAAAQPPEASKAHEYKVGAGIQPNAPTSGTVYVGPTHSKRDDIPSYQIGPSLEDLQKPYVSPTLASWRDKHPYIANTERAYELFYGTLEILKDGYAGSKKPVRKAITQRLADVMKVSEKEAKKVLKGE